jgi:hypothetical protein
MRIGGVRLFALVLLFLALLNTRMMVTSNKALSEVNSFVEQVCWPAFVVCAALCFVHNRFLAAAVPTGRGPQVLDRQRLSSIHSLQQLKDEFVRVSADSKQLMLMSSSNLLDAVPGDLELVSQLSVFSAPERLELQAGTRVRVDGPEWTLSAWVRLDRGNILKQVAGNSETTCWAWEVDGTQMQLRFGGHDSEAETVLQGFPMKQRRAPKTAQGDVDGGAYAAQVSDADGGAPAAGGFADGGTTFTGLQHVAVVIKQRGSARFFRNGALNASAPLTRDITACIGPIVIADVRLSISPLCCLPCMLRASPSLRVQQPLLTVCLDLYQSRWSR